MNYVCIDIETVKCAGDDLEVELSLVKPQRNIINNEKRKENVEKKQEEIRKKELLQDMAQIGCIGAKTPEESFCFTSFEGITEQELHALRSAKIRVEPQKNERDMLNSFCDFADEFITRETEIVHFNGIGFDLPKIRGACARHKVTIPDCLQTNANSYDLMLKYGKYFSVTAKYPYFISINEVLNKFKVCDGKPISGEMFEEMVSNGDYITAILYNTLDNIYNEAIYLRMK